MDTRKTRRGENMDSDMMDQGTQDSSNMRGDMNRAASEQTGMGGNQQQMKGQSGMMGSEMQGQGMQGGMKDSEQDMMSSGGKSGESGMMGSNKQGGMMSGSDKMGMSGQQGQSKTGSNDDEDDWSSHATGDSKLPKKVQEMAPESLERAMPDMLHDTSGKR